MAVFSVCANIAMFMGVGIILYFLVEGEHSATKDVASPRQFPLYFGTVLYGFEGIGLVRNCFSFMLIDLLTDWCF